MAWNSPATPPRMAAGMYVYTVKRTFNTQLLMTCQASKICWNECTDCYSSAGATGDANCKIWEAKCTAMDNACNAGNFNGPPNAGKDLTPPFASPNVPALAVETLSTSGAQATAVSAAAHSTTASVTAVAYAASTSSAAAAPASTSAAQSSCASEDTCGSNGGQTCASGLCCSSHG